MPQSSRRFFTLEEANRLLPEVRRLVEPMTELARDIHQRRQRLSDLTAYRGESFGPYRDELIAMLEELESDSRRLREYLIQLSDLGVEPKGVLEGIVDFPAKGPDGEILLCWKLGEPQIRYYHDPSSGFAGRRPVQELFDRGEEAG
ncbi:DUF2203 domain-containing protein [Thermostilla marina]